MNKIKRINHLKFLEPFVSVVFWGLLFASPLLFRMVEEDQIEWDHIFRVWRTFLPYLGLYLVNRFVFLPLFLFRGKRWLFFISNMVLIVATATVMHIYSPNVHGPRPMEDRSETMGNLSDRPPGERPPGDRPPGDRPPRQQPPRQLPPFISFMVVSILIIGFDSGLLISVKWAQSEQERIRAEKENMASQLAFLQNQVSPHFFMNTLNNIHSLIDIDASEAKEAIIKLSKLMRHMLYDSQVQLIPLKKEIEFISSYVELMKLRFSDKVRINLHIPDKISEKSVPPMLFTSFVENAFKHGISYQAKSFIDISFANGSDKLSFVIRNSNPGMKKEEGPPGIGIENSRKRLDLIYGDSYTLDIIETPDEFTVSLKIPA